MKTPELEKLEVLEKQLQDIRNLILDVYTFTVPPPMPDHLKNAAVEQAKMVCDT